MQRVGRMYRLKNGFKISRIRMYYLTGYQYFFTIFTPNGEHYCNCGTWEEAYDTASKLVGGKF